LSNTFHKSFRANALDGSLAGGINIENKQAVRLGKSRRELIHERLGPAVPVGLEYNVNPAVATLPGGRKGRLDLGWVMAIVIHDCDPAFLPPHLNAAVDRAKLLKRTADVLHAYVETD